jgi:hypothetical protein
MSPPFFIKPQLEKVGVFLYSCDVFEWKVRID